MEHIKKLMSGWTRRAQTFFTKFSFMDLFVQEKTVLTELFIAKKSYSLAWWINECIINGLRNDWINQLIEWRIE